jgi:hypothetical protein
LSAANAFPIDWGSKMNIRCAALFALVAAFAVTPALGGDLAFTAALRGDAAPTNTGSAARGDAKITVHSETQTIDVTMTVAGIRFADFWKNLHHAPMGPIHFHHYAANGEVTLLVPFPFGPSYSETKDGFALTVVHYPYADGAKILQSSMSFDDFVTAMKGGAIVMNIHTEKFHDGEISGAVKLAP